MTWTIVLQSLSRGGVTHLCHRSSPSLGPFLDVCRECAQLGHWSWREDCLLVSLSPTVSDEFCFSGQPLFSFQCSRIDQ